MNLTSDFAISAIFSEYMNATAFNSLFSEFMEVMASYNSQIVNNLTSDSAISAIFSEFMDAIDSYYSPYD